MDARPRIPAAYTPQATQDVYKRQLQGDETYQDVELITINGIQAIIYVNTTLNNYGTIIPFSDGTMSVQMEMGPAGDQANAQTLMTLMATVDTIQ